MTSDREYQIKNLEKITNDAALSPIFKRNPKYPVEGVARISYSDIMDYKFVIRNDKDFSDNSCWSEDADIIVEYKCIEDLVDDGWRLD